MCEIRNLFRFRLLCHANTQNGRTVTLMNGKRTRFLSLLAVGKKFKTQKRIRTKLVVSPATTEFFVWFAFKNLHLVDYKKQKNRRFCRQNNRKKAFSRGVPSTKNEQARKKNPKSTYHFPWMVVDGKQEADAKSWCYITFTWTKTGNGTLKVRERQTFPALGHLAFPIRNSHRCQLEKSCGFFGVLKKLGQWTTSIEVSFFFIKFIIFSLVRFGSVRFVCLPF